MEKLLEFHVIRAGTREAAVHRVGFIVEGSSQKVWWIQENGEKYGEVTISANAKCDTCEFFCHEGVLSTQYGSLYNCTSLKDLPFLSSSSFGLALNPEMKEMFCPRYKKS